jgi:hypothetical protein
LRDVASLVGITERAVQRIVADLEEGEYLTRERSRRRNHYEVHADRPLRHPAVVHHRVAGLLELFLGQDPLCEAMRAGQNAPWRRGEGRREPFLPMKTRGGTPRSSC